MASIETRPRRRDTYSGSLLLNLAAFTLPALYSTLSKLWVARIDTSLVTTTDAYTYTQTAAEALNEGLPRATFLVIGDAASRAMPRRLQLTHTLLVFQTLAALLLSIVFCAAAPAFCQRFVAAPAAPSIVYVRITSFTVLSDSIEYAVGVATGALDTADVPLVISSIKFAVNIALDFMIISKFRINKDTRTATVNDQAAIQLGCGLVAAATGLVYFVWSNTWPLWREQQRSERHDNHNSSHQCHSKNSSLRPTFRALGVLVRPGSIFFAESAVSNALYLWLVSGIVALGPVYATAWGVFNTIRWGLVMVPVQALEVSALAHVGHRWGIWRKRLGVSVRKPPAGAVSWGDLRTITTPAWISAGLALAVEVPLAVGLSIWGARPFALFVSDSPEVADVAARMWRTIDWCYIFYALSTQAATVLQATRSRWYLYQSLASNVMCTLPWAVFCQTKHLDEKNAWTYHAFVFGGSLVFSFFDIALWDALWAWTLRSGKARLEAWRE